jgi:hypothetical protein
MKQLQIDFTAIRHHWLCTQGRLFQEKIVAVKTYLSKSSKPSMHFAPEVFHRFKV